MGDKVEKKRLLVTASTFPRWEGDTEPRFVMDLCQALTEYFDVTVLVPAAPGAQDVEMMGDVKVIRYHYFPIHKWETLCYPGAIVPRIKEKKIRILLVPFLIFALYINLLKYLPEVDVVHAHWLIPQGIIQSLFKKPYIVTGHGGDVTSLNFSILKKLKARCLKNAKCVTVVSQFLKDEVLAIENVEDVRIMPMGCNTENFSPDYKIENYFNQQEKKVVLFVGRLAEKKGVKYLIEAMKDIDGLLAIVGKGPLENELKEQAKELGEKVIFLGPKTHSELKQIYASADIFAAPSVTAKDGDKEGFGLVILEAMASGLPVVAYDSGGISELIQSELNGILVEEANVELLRDNIKRLLDNPAEWGKYSVAAMETAEKYDYKNIAKGYSEILGDL